MKIPKKNFQWHFGSVCYLLHLSLHPVFLKRVIRLNAFIAYKTMIKYSSLYHDTVWWLRSTLVYVKWFQFCTDQPVCRVEPPSRRPTKTTPQLGNRSQTQHPNIQTLANDHLRKCYVEPIGRTICRLKPSRSLDHNADRRSARYQTAELRV